MDEGSALLSMDEQEEAFIDTSNGNSPGELARRETQLLVLSCLLNRRPISHIRAPHWQPKAAACLVTAEQPLHAHCSAKATGVSSTRLGILVAVRAG